MKNEGAGGKIGGGSSNLIGAGSGGKTDEGHKDEGVGSMRPGDTGPSR